LIANTLYPILFTSHPSKYPLVNLCSAFLCLTLVWDMIVLDLVGSPFNFTVNLRFLELFYVGPLLQDRPVYTSLYSLWVDFWSCIRTFPKPAKETTKDVKKGEVRVYKKDMVR
jgi:hypothetical protein